MTEADQTANGLSFRDHADRLITAVRRLIENSLRLLRDTDQPILNYVWRAWLIGLVPSIVISIIVTSALGLLGYEDKLPDMSLMFFLIGGVLIAPWVETVLMGWGLAILKRIIKSTLWVCLASAVIWGVLHGLQPGFALGLPAAWLFFVMSLCFVEWEKKSRAKAIRVTALVHMCQNSLAFILVLFFVVLGAETPEAKKVPPSPPVQQKGGLVSVGKPPAVASASAAGKTAEMSEERKRKVFHGLFPGFGLDEYLLANEDLYPEWKKDLAPNGTWREFLLFYNVFVRWRNARASSPEAEYTLWKDFLAQRKPTKNVETEPPAPRLHAEPENERKK